MRHATRIMCMSALVFATTRAGAQVPDSTPTLSDELLQLWNKNYNVESNVEDAGWDDSGFELDDSSGASPVGTGYQRPGGGALTPNLDRLLGNGMEAAPDPSAPVAKDSPYGFAPSSGMSKGGSAGNTIDTGRSHCGSRGHRHDHRCRPEPPRCGERGHRHDLHCRPHSPRCGERGHRHDRRCRPGHNPPPPPPGCNPPPHTPPTPTPEPASMLLLGLGAGAAAGARAIRNRRKN